MSSDQHNSPPDELTWFKSSYSGTNGGDCVEVAMVPGTVHVRDSKRPDGPALSVHRDIWPVFLAYATGTDTGA
ncbi:DUF397 domain-containing protein [Streptomyces sp. WAC 00631]|uniref:DUF397 domain-containing protein n=1 Tax=unclassified Streptomyces TaxID=2593676 RepID=UPI000F7B395A|nr:MULTISPECIES: DUF397 domain-containing protein [unclassified Streptomyces]MCC5034055.1 DUF397 domain-containing protein [Streptomyces sp. WAC 00631]MCC9742559.1 DUF397 domain-containing protein [Streptomyces sp. MNU89]